MRKISLVLMLVVQTCLGQPLPLKSLQLPPGFSINIYAYPVEDAREMTLGTNNIIFVGSREAGKVYAIIPDQQAPYKHRVITIAENLQMPNGVAFYQNDLYVADLDKILLFDNIENHLTNPPPPTIITDVLPKETHHGWRYIAFGPDGKLYIAIGAPCNTCLREDERFATIMRMNPDGSKQEIYARGIRNSVGFDWDPINQQFWFTDNGRDGMGDNLPPDELNHASKKDMHFGFPYCYGYSTADADYNNKFPCSAFAPPVIEFPAHVATLGMKFYKGNMFPTEYKNQIFVAEHGSWNRSNKIGYQVISVNKTKNSSIKPFISGWLKNEKNWGRPVDILEMPDGSLLISDDYANVIYQVTYQKKN